MAIMSEVWIVADTREEVTSFGVFMKEGDAVAACRRLTDCVFSLEFGKAFGKAIREPILARFPVVERAHDDIEFLWKEVAADRVRGEAPDTLERMERVLRVLKANLPQAKRWVNLRVL